MFAFVVFPKREVPGTVVLLVLTEEVPKIDDVPVRPIPLREGYGLWVLETYGLWYAFPRPPSQWTGLAMGYYRLWVFTGMG